MAEYIAKWGRRVGYDLNAQPSEGQKTHAIIQVLRAAGLWWLPLQVLQRLRPPEYQNS